MVFNKRSKLSLIIITAGLTIALSVFFTTPVFAAETSPTGIIAEKPEKFGQVLFFFVIPETLWIIGFVLGIILLLGIL